jgi:hypothetical protein
LEPHGHGDMIYCSLVLMSFEEIRKGLFTKCGG